MNISIIIPNYNGKKLLQKNLPKVFEAAYFYAKKSNSEVEVVIVDDDSTDNSVSSIKYYVLGIKDKNVAFKILQNEKNLGFSSTINKGVMDAKGEIVVLLNTDVAPQKYFLEPLIASFKDENVFAVGCMDKSIEGKKTILRGRGIGKWRQGFLVHARGEVDKTNTLWVSGGSGAFRKTMWEKIGGFNELYNPFYWEDIDISYRALKAGYKVLFEPKSTVFHEHEKGAIKKKYSLFQIKIIAYRNQFIFVWENLTDLDLQLLHILWLPYHFVKSLLKGDFAFILGFFQAFIRLPKIIQSSFKAQKIFIKKDKDIVGEFVE